MEPAATQTSFPEDELTLTHPLEHEWTFWYDRRQGMGNLRVKNERDSYENNLHQIGTFATVEDFWRYYNHMAKPTQLENNSNYQLFKAGIKPLWEDAANAKGGKWIIQLKKSKGRLCDEYWENLVLGMIGETLEVDDEICGAVMSRRKAGDKIALWNRSSDKTNILALGKKIREQLGMSEDEEIVYQNHSDAMRTGASYRNINRYTLP